MAKARRAKSITISNTKSEPKQSLSNITGHDILDQEALLDFTHPTLRRSCPTTSTESQRQAGTAENPRLLQGEHRKENISKDKQKVLPSGATGKQKSLSESDGIKSVNVHRESQSVFDELATQPSLRLQKKCTNYLQNRHHTQTAGSVSRLHSWEQMNSKRSAASPITQKTSFSTDPLSSQSTVSPNIKTRKGRFDLHSEKKVDAACLSDRSPSLQTATGNSETGLPLNIQSKTQRQRLWTQSQTLQMDVQSAVSQSEGGSKDYSCKSRHIDQEEESQCAHGLNRLKTCLAAPQTREASRPASVKSSTSQAGNCPKPDIRAQKHWLDHTASPGQNKNHNEVKLSDTTLNQRDIFTPPDHHVLPIRLLEYPSEKSWSPSVALSPNSPVNSNGVLISQSQHGVYQRPREMTTASLQPNDSLRDRAFITDEPEDPYYVTMYATGSVYVGE